MKKNILFIVLLFMSLNMSIVAQDKFHVFLCFGQSNMEGHAKIEAQDTIYIDGRFMMLQTVDCPELGRFKGNWYKAIPPLARCHTGLSPADYFGRTMVANLPSDTKVGVINVAVGGCRIELFDKENFQSYVDQSPEWLKNMVNEYDGNPYARLIEMAKLAQSQGGVIKGILLHQGESNNGETDWPQKVKKTYENILKDLNLEPNSVPLLAGELLDEEQYGACANMNLIINTLPNVIPNAHVISSKGCEGVKDRLHFSAAGYRTLGTRYAEKMLQLYNENSLKK